jgi:hypothetical protein
VLVSQYSVFVWAITLPGLALFELTFYDGLKKPQPLAGTL